MNTPQLSYPRAPQIAANPKDAEHYIKSQAEEINRLRAALTEIATYSADTSRYAEPAIGLKFVGDTARIALGHQQTAEPGK